MSDKPRTFWEKFWRDADGNIALWQFPNPPLLVWLITMIGAKLAEGNLHDGLSFLSQAALAVWAYLEITDGISYFRRTLGAMVAIALVVRHFM